MVTTLWRAFIGSDLDPNPDYVHHDHTMRGWTQARDWMISMLRAWETDDCDDCAEDAAAELDRLLALDPDTECTEWTGYVEGDTYAIVKTEEP